MSDNPQYRVRLPAEVAQELERRAVRGTTVPALIASAVQKVYMPGGLDESLEDVHAQLLKSDLRHRRQELRHQVLLESFLVFVRGWLEAVPEVPEAEKTAAGAVADKRLARMMDVVAQTVGTRSSIMGRSTRMTELLFDPDLGRDVAVEERARAEGDATEEGGGA